MASFYHRTLPLWILYFYVLAVVGASLTKDPPTYLWHQRRALKNPPVHKRQNTSSYELQQAQKLVAEAVAQQSEYNTYRVANPRRNTYESRHSATAKHKRAGEPAPPTLNTTLLAAAALVAEHHAAQKLSNGTLHNSYTAFTQLPRPLVIPSQEKRATSDYWVPLADHGVPPMGSDSSYPVYRDVTDAQFGAKGDGVTDDTAAINAAIAYGGNCGEGCLSSSTTGTLIYFPPGTYLISTPINAYYYSQLVGDPNDLPIIKTSASFIGLGRMPQMTMLRVILIYEGAIQSDVYIPNDNGNEWYVEQSNFYRQVRNLIIDITDTTTASAAGLHWQVAQATSLTNVLIMASVTDSTTTQMGIYTENGSGGFMSDCSLIGGKYGIYGGNQQYTVRDFQISAQTNSSICLIWDWGWTWSGLYLAGSPVGITLINPQAPSGQQAGSTYIMDTSFDGTATAIEAKFEESTILDTSIITLDNVGVYNVDTMVQYSNGNSLALPVSDVDFVVIGNLEVFGAQNYGQYTVLVQEPPPSLLGTATSWYRDSYFTKSRPQYEDLTTDSIVSVKDHGAMGDGVTDDTASIISALALATTSNLIYFPPGSYIISSTIVIPPHARITGQVWSQLVASGSHFADMASPKPMIQVGTAGDVGTVEISDMLFTSIGELPGLIMVEWNVQAETQGSVGIWDSHFRVGGAYGTKLQVAECPMTESIQTACMAAAMMLHITPEANGYFENMWAWVADHDIDDAANTQITVAVARGILIESTQGPTWFYGTASEHSMLYQYNFYNATNTFAGMIQTESPYFQFTTATESPGPFKSSVGLFTNDPVFPDSTCTASSELCNFGWAVIIEDNTNLTVAGAGLYSWYDNYLETCVDTQNCQQRLVLDSGGNSGLYLWNLITIGAVEMISNTYTNETILAKNNTQAIAHPFWSALGGYLDDYAPKVLSCAWNDTRAACEMEFNCDLTLTFDSVSSLQQALGSFPDQCVDYYMLNTLYTILEGSMTNYTAANAGYDSVFGDYVTYTKEMVPDALQAFMAGSTPSAPDGGPGNKYFSCTCEGFGGTSTQQCPFTYTQLQGALSFTMTYTLVDAAGFYNDLQTNYAINQSWVTFADIGGPGRPTICRYGTDSCGDPTDYRYVNVPQAVSSDQITVTNPKSVITSALPTISTLENTLLARQMDVNLGQWTGSFDDLVQTLSMPVFMIQQAVIAMASVKAIGEQEAKQKKIDLILEILGIAFIFIPFLDDLAPELEALDGVFETIATVGNVALGVQSIISDPTSAPMEILGLLTGSGVRTEEDFATMAAARRSLSDQDVTDIGANFKKADTEFQDTVKPSCRI
ncbi:pectin lyase fold factor [Coleophoma cylindrospora]|uniref:Pectin lyase fold factor n=1 Tax=Coleophoma cylindrospora TaxID=1849047 RepID=A0A3D8Q4K5_9HELO|nr:pectin lyase fold factor [Coleophoma cylindrospora]